MNTNLSTVDLGIDTSKPMSPPVQAKADANAALAESRSTQPTPVNTIQQHAQAVSTGSTNTASLSQLLNLMKPTLEMNNNLVKTKNLVYKQMYDAPLTDEEKKALTPGLKVAIESGNRTLMDAQIRGINDQIKGLGSTVDTAVSDVLNYQQKMNDSRDAAIKAISANPEVAQLYGYDTLKSLGINPASAGVGVVGGYDMGNYATNPNNVNQLNQIYNSQALQSVSDAQSAQAYIQQYAPNSPITGDMIMQVSQQTGVDPKMLLTVAQNESNFGTLGVAARTNNVGNVGNVDSGATVSHATPIEGLMALAQNLSGRYVGSQTSNSAAGITQSGDISIDSQSGGYSTAKLPGIGLTQAGLDIAAMQYASTGTMPSLGLGSGSTVANTRAAIINRAAEINQGGSVAANKENLAANANALKQQVTYKNQTEQALNKAEAGFNQVMDAFKGSGINTSDSQFLNKTVNEITKQLTGGQLFAFQAGLTEVANDYAQVFARGGQRSVQGNELAQNTVNANISMSDLVNVQKELQAQGQTVIVTADQQISSIQVDINKMFKSNTQPAQGTGNASDPLGLFP